MNVHIQPTYNLELTQDEYIAMIAALFISKKEYLIKHYSKDFSNHMINSIDETQVKLAQKFSDVYHIEQSADIIKEIKNEFLKKQ